MHVVLLSAASLLIGCTLGVPAPAEAPSRIAFVRVELSESGARVVSTETVAGQLKARRGGPVAVPPGHLRLDVMAGDAATAVWSDAVADPLERRVEYVDESGALATRVERVAVAEVTVRVPVVAERQTLAFSRPSQAGLVPMARVEVSL
ncbi:hypothetical protein [Rubrivirga sp.]|uniref:hypothetical protein n=1 Tax=Rubrivirga sp. TaxID=1885344 RepID=UPI003B5299B9